MQKIMVSLEDSRLDANKWRLSRKPKGVIEMPTDRVYQDIIRALRTEQLDDKVFEKIGVRIANHYGVKVIPMPGGQDAGSDGAIVDTDGDLIPGPLVATMQENGLANLRNNLIMHAETYPEASKNTFFVTTRPKSNRKKKNLTREAKERGYILLGIADESAVGEHLYYNPCDCYELLGFRGVPPALSPLPPRRRKHWEIELVARDATIDKLRELTKDMLLYGIPGSGKTSLLSQMAAEGLGLFVHTTDRDRLAPDLREFRPKSVFIDGLNDPFEAAEELVSLREESGISFNIVVTGWNEDERVIELLGLTPEQRVGLGLLGLDELVKVVEHAGIMGPRELIHNIVHQAAGSPGLVVTLTMACRNKNIREVVTGEILLRQVRMMLQNLSLDEKIAESALAAFAVGGDAGMKLEDVTSAIGISPLQLQPLLRDIDAGGIIRPKGSRRVSVQPELLRTALVKSTFYSDYSAPVESLHNVAPSRSSSLLTLISAAQYAYEPPWLKGLLTVTDPKVFYAYACLGPEQCRWVITEHPDYLSYIYEACLHYIPEEILPQLIAAAKGDERRLNSTPEHPLRIISDWCKSAIPGRSEVVKRREMVINAALQYLRETGDIETSIRAFSQALTVEFSNWYPDPGVGRTMTKEWGVIQPEEIEALGQLWQRCLESIRGHSNLPWGTLLEAARGISIMPVNDTEKIADSRVTAGRLLFTMALDIYQLGDGHPGVAHEARQITSEQQGWPPASEQERLYDLLFGNFYGDDFQEREAEVTQQLAALADEWSRRNSEEVLSLIASLGAAAEEVHHRGADRRRFLGHLLSVRVEGLSWLRAAIQTNLDYEVVIPFVKTAILNNTCGWGDVVRSCIGTPSETAAIQGMLLAGGPPELIANVIPLLPKYTSLVGHLCILNQVSPDAYWVLLSHEDDHLASEAAINLWHGTDGNIGDANKPLWRNAFLRSKGEASWFGGILSTDATLSFDWLKSRIEADDWVSFRRERTIQEAASQLNDDQRVELLLKFSNTSFLDSLILLLFGNSVTVFTRLLEVGGQKHLCLMALERLKDEIWAELVITGYDNGLSVDDLARASNRVSGWQSTGSENYEKRIAQVEPFLKDPRGPVRIVASRMIECLKANREKALAEEQEERMWGFR